MNAEPDGGRRLLLLGGAALAALLVVVVAIVISQAGDDDEAPAAGDGAPAAEQQRQRQEVRGPFEGIPQRGLTLGDPGAPATLIEFVDLQCPFCAQYSVEALPTVVRQFVRSGRLRLELQLLTFLGPDSERGAQVAAAAALQNRGWEYSELFFRNQGAENSGYATDRFLRRLARQTPGLDVPQLSSDLGTPPARRLVSQATARGERLGVKGTPSFYLVRDGGSPEPLGFQALDAGSVTATLNEALGSG